MNSIIKKISAIKIILYKYVYITYKLLPTLFLSKKHCINTSQFITIEVDGYKNTFFGYYDKSPINPDNKNLLIFHANNHNSKKKPSPISKTSIILFDLNNFKYQEIGYTNAWNWQQGARLHWLNAKCLIYNFFDDSNKSYKASIYNIDNGKSYIIPYPVQDSYKDEYIISIDFSALNKTRPDYGYRNIPEHFHHQLIYYNLKTKDTYILLDVNILAKQIIGVINFNKFLYRVNHVHISPDGDKFVFLFRYNIGSIRKHYLYLYRFLNNSFDLQLSNETISHYKWIDNVSIIYWGSYKGSTDYHILNTDSKKVINTKLRLVDGHPSIIDHNSFITDTYPDHRRRRNLFKIDLISNNIIKIASFYESPLYGGQTRCDLHPNYSSKFKIINVDVIIKGKRKLALLKLDDDL